MLERLHRFADAAFKRECAHGGIDTIAFARVLGSAAINWVDLVRIPPGHSIGCHTHGHEDEEVYIVIDGKGILTIEDRQIEVGAGDVAHNPPGGTHGLHNHGERELRLVVIGVPARSVSSCGLARDTAEAC